MADLRSAPWPVVLSFALSVFLAAHPSPARAQAGGVTLNLVSWSYGVEIVRDNIGKFQQRHPGSP